MVERYIPPSNGAGAVEAVENDSGLGFIHTGCTVLNCIISGRGDRGWPLGRVVNIIGDRSSGKTLIAEEAMVNFARVYPKGWVHYRDTEAAFDVSYARALGLDTDVIDFGANGPDTQWTTMEELCEDLTGVLNEFDERVRSKAKQLRERNRRLSAGDAQAKALAAMPPSLYITDSLDGLSSEAELKRDIREGSYNLQKQKLLNELFRKEVKRIRQANMCFMVINQTRQRIGVTHGKKYTRSGGKALEFYASVELYLSEMGKVFQTVKGVKRPIGIKVRARNEKNKIASPYRDCQFEIRFLYGIDDECSSIDYLEEVKRLKDAGFDKAPDPDKVDKEKLRRDVSRIWLEVERGFVPEKGKYA